VALPPSTASEKLVFIGEVLSHEVLLMQKKLEPHSTDPELGFPWHQAVFHLIGDSG
jgi:hypothetical protein